MWNDTVVIGLLTITTGIAIAVIAKKKGESSTYFGIGAILSWALLFFYLFYLPETVIVPTPNPLTALSIQGILIFAIILFEAAGFYYLTKQK
jgi:hypothetical protein